MTNEQKLQLCQQRFQNTLVGTWVTIEGTFFLMSETFVFEDNGKGTRTQASGRRECKTFFDWRIIEPFVVEIMVTKVEYTPEISDSDIEEDEEEGMATWNKFEYEFKIITNDTGQEIALCNKGSEYFYDASLRVGLAELP